jgi:hypothetical protein
MEEAFHFNAVMRIWIDAEDNITTKRSRVRVAAFLRKSGIRIDVRPVCGPELDVFWPTHPELA